MTPATMPTDRPRTILLVDDEQSVRSIVMKILKRANYNVIEAGSGEEALRISNNHTGPIDLVVTDMFMPGMRGPEVVQNLMPKRPGIKVLFMSGYADHEARASAPAGSVFLNKPFSGQELSAAIEGVLNS